MASSVDSRVLLGFVEHAGRSSNPVKTCQKDHIAEYPVSGMML